MHQPRLRIPPPTVVLPIAVFFAAFAYALVMDRRGLIQLPDSASYLGAASNLLHGRGLTTPAEAFTSEYHLSQAVRLLGRQPYVEFGPLYPTLIAGVSLLGATLDGAARIVNCVATGMLALSGFLIARRLFTRSLSLPVAAAAFLVFAPATPEHPFPPFSPMRLNTLALSESLTFGLSALSLCIFLAFLLDRRPVQSAGALLLAGLAASTRFQLLSLVFAEVVIILFLADDWGKRVRTGAQAAVIGAAPFLVFLLLESAVFHEHSGEPLAYHSTTDAAGALLHWLFGGLFGTPLSTALTASVLVASIAGILLGYRRTGFRIVRSVWLWMTALTVFVAAEVTFLWLTKTWLNAYVTIDQRMLSSAQIGLYLLLLTLVCQALQANFATGGYWESQLGLPAVACVAATAAVVAAGIPATRLDLTARRESPEMRAVGALPRHTVLFTDDPPDVYLWLGRPSVLTPLSYFVVTARSNYQLTGDIDDMVSILRSCGGEVALVSDSNLVPRAAILKAVSRLGRMQHIPDGGITVEVPPPTDPTPDCPVSPGAAKTAAATARVP